jgi:peptide/nickel transport system ATP-binding protein
MKSSDPKKPKKGIADELTEAREEFSDALKQMREELSGGVKEAKAEVAQAKQEIQDALGIAPDEEIHPENLLEIKKLTVKYRTDEALVHALNGVSLTVGRGETLGILGETGAGKTTLALSVMRLLPERVGEVAGGEIQYDGRDLLSLSNARMRAIRGKRISMVFQDPMASLNPLIPVGQQIAEALLLHNETDMTNSEIGDAVDRMLTQVGIPPQRKREFPHQFSGGMKQRVVIAIALACSPELLIADEPTTALDVTIQAQVLAMMQDLKAETGTSIILITHDLGVVAEMCDRVAVMYAGEIVEIGTVYDIFEKERHHPYVDGLFGSVPDIETTARRLRPIDGLMPDPSDLPPGCKFEPRCPKAKPRCAAEPPRAYTKDSHTIRCLLFGADAEGRGKINES